MENPAVNSHLASNASLSGVQAQTRDLKTALPGGGVVFLGPESLRTPQANDQEFRDVNERFGLAISSLLLR